MQQGAELRRGGGGGGEMFEKQADVGSSVADQDPPLSDQYYIYFNTKIKTLTDTPVQKLIIGLDTSCQIFCCCFIKRNDLKIRAKRVELIRICNTRIQESPLPKMRGVHYTIYQNDKLSRGRGGGGR